MGFDRCELMATLSGILLYEKKGYKVEEEIDYKSKAGNSVPMYKMIKSLV
jgi:ribosomal protein S18 acetylase RimI-like enzyme